MPDRGGCLFVLSEEPPVDLASAAPVAFHFKVGGFAKQLAGESAIGRPGDGGTSNKARKGSLAGAS